MNQKPDKKTPATPPSKTPQPKQAAPAPKPASPAPGKAPAPKKS